MGGEPVHCPTLTPLRLPLTLCRTGTQRRGGYKAGCKQRTGGKGRPIRCNCVWTRCCCHARAHVPPAPPNAPLPLKSPQPSSSTLPRPPPRAITLLPGGYFGRQKLSGALHTIQRGQCTVGARVTVKALHTPFPRLLHRRSHPSTLPFLPGLGVGGPLAVVCLSFMVCVGIGGPYCCHAPLGPLFMDGLRLFGPRKFRCVASHPLPCRHQSHTKPTILDPSARRFVVA